MYFRKIYLVTYRKVLDTQEEILKIWCTTSWWLSLTAFHSTHEVGWIDLNCSHEKDTMKTDGYFN